MCIYIAGSMCLFFLSAALPLHVLLIGFCNVMVKNFLFTNYDVLVSSLVPLFFKNETYGFINDEEVSFQQRE